jgi:hypothetical protein
LISACASLRPSIEDRDLLLGSIRQFHRALADQDTARALRYLPPDQRSRSQALLNCFYRRIRVLEYRLGELESTGDPKEAKISVQVTSQAWNDLAAREFLWEEQWVFADQGWNVRLDFEPFLGLETDCTPVSP